MVSQEDRSFDASQSWATEPSPPMDEGAAPGEPVGPGIDPRSEPFTPPRRSGTSILRNPLVAWLAAGVLLGVLIIMTAVTVPVLRAEAQREEVRERAEIMAARVTTFEGATIDEWVQETRALATGDYAEQLAELFDTELRETLRENEVESVGEIQRSFVQRLEGDTAEVFVLARQTSVNALRETPSEDELRIEVTMRRVDGEWLASNIVVLGPQQPAAGQAPVPEPEGEIAPEAEEPEPEEADEADEPDEPDEEGATDG